MFTDVYESKIRKIELDNGKEKEDGMEVDEEGEKSGSLKRKRDNMSGQKKEEEEKKEEKEEGDENSLKKICGKFFPKEVTPSLASMFWSLSFYDVHVPKGSFLFLFFLFSLMHFPKFLTPSLFFFSLLFFSFFSFLFFFFFFFFSIERYEEELSKYFFPFFPFVPFSFSPLISLPPSIQT